MHTAFRVLALLLLLPLVAHAQAPARIYAAASLTDALTDIAEQWRQAGHPQPVLVLAASSSLARQIERGAPADLFASADPAWMDYLAERKKIDPDSRVDLVGNELVLIAPIDQPVSVEMRHGFNLAAAFGGKLCVAEPDVVPAGTYAMQALTSLGWWEAIAPRIVGTDDVRAALAFVERGACSLGIVYATDAAISRKVTVIGRFPPESHAPIVYPLALIPGARVESRAFAGYLRTDAASAIFRRHGFVPRSP